MALNVALLKRIKKHILEKPRRFVMRTFVDRAEYYDSGDRKRFLNDADRYTKFESCGTAACIGGWAVLLEDGLDVPLCNIRGRAIEVLGLERIDGMRDDVFEVGCWPMRFGVPYQAAKTQRQRVRIAAKFIDFLIKHGPALIEDED